MPRKRQSIVESESSEDEQRRKVRRQEESSDEEPQRGEDVEEMVKKLVRLALASEFSRTPLRRTDITTKVMGAAGRGLYKQVWEQAQFTLQNTFGMKLEELPLREKVTISQRRAAQRTEKSSSSSKSFILVSTLDKKFRHDPFIIPPPKQPTTDEEAIYVGLYTFVISLIYLCGGTIGESKLDTQLAKLGVEQKTPLDKTEKVLARMAKESYIVKVKENRGGEEVVEYMVGPRGKTEVGKDGVFGVVKQVYPEDVDDLEARLNRSLGLRPAQVNEPTQEEESDSE